MSTIYEHINAALVTLGKRKGSRDEQSSGDGQGPGGSRKREHRLSFQPFSQKDLLQRLQTYKCVAREIQKSCRQSCMGMSNGR